MKITNAFITFTKEDIPLPKVIALNDENDLLENCEIKER